MNGSLLHSLLARLDVARDKRAIQGLLGSVKTEQGLSPDQLRISGSKADLLHQIRVGVNGGFILIDRLLTLVDRLEENGGQHLFLFDLTPEGAAALRPSAFQSAFASIPSTPTPAMYADMPSQAELYFQQRPDALVVKQIYAAAFWERDESRSYENEDERSTVMVRCRRRALNVFRVTPDQQKAEIRIDRVKHGIGDKNIAQNLQGFVRDLAPVLDVSRHLIPTRIWKVFSAIINCRDGTYMSTDVAEDPSVKVQLSNRRAEDAGKDVRDHPSYQFSTTEYARDQVNIYWDTEPLVRNWDPERGDLKRVHTMLSRFVLDGHEYGKVYIPATVSPEVLSGVTERIRSFAN